MYPPVNRVGATEWKDSRLARALLFSLNCQSQQVGSACCPSAKSAPTSSAAYPQSPTTTQTGRFAGISSLSRFLLYLTLSCVPFVILPLCAPIIKWLRLFLKKLDLFITHIKGAVNAVTWRKMTGTSWPPRLFFIFFSPLLPPLDWIIANHHLTLIYISIEERN